MYFELVIFSRQKGMGWFLFTISLLDVVLAYQAKQGKEWFRKKKGVEAWGNVCLLECIEFWSSEWRCVCYNEKKSHLEVKTVHDAVHYQILGPVLADFFKEYLGCVTNSTFTFPSISWKTVIDNDRYKIFQLFWYFL